MELRASMMSTWVKCQWFEEHAWKKYAIEGLESSPHPPGIAKRAHGKSVSETHSLPWYLAFQQQHSSLVVTLAHPHKWAPAIPNETILKTKPERPCPPPLVTLAKGSRVSTCAGYFGQTASSYCWDSKKLLICMVIA